MPTIKAKTRYQILDDVTVDQMLRLESAVEFIEGTNVTYSGGRGTPISRLAGEWSGTLGGFHGLYSRVNTSGIFASANAGVVGVKSLVQNVGAQTIGNVYGGQSIAKHAHATAKMANEAPLVGFEAIAYQSGVGQAGTMIGLSAVVRADGTPAAYDSGAVHRGIQITMDYPGNVPSEISALTAWNMSGAQDNVINVVNSGSGFTNFAKFTDDDAPAKSTGTRTGESGWIKVLVGTETRYIRLYTT